MSNAEIATYLAKHPSWVCRTVQRLREEQATAYASDPERAAVAEANQQFDRLIAAALEVRDSAGNTEKGLAAIQAAADVLNRKLRFQLRTGQIQCRDGAQDAPPNLLKTPIGSAWKQTAADIADNVLLAMADAVRTNRGPSFPEEPASVNLFDRP